MKQHDVKQLMTEAAEDLARRYQRLQQRVLEDPGTAGDQGEENWADLLRNWLPSTFPVVTKGRMLSYTGQAGPQIDVLVLRPSYPRGLLNEKLYLADGVAAAFECKVTLRKSYVEAAVRKAAAIRALVTPRAGTPERELNSSLFYGLLAHSHEWKGPRSRPIQRISKELNEADQTITRHPREMIDVICVADLSTWRADKCCLSPLLGPEQSVLTPAGFKAMYMVQTPGRSRSSTDEEWREHPVLPISALLTALLGRLAVEHEELAWLAAYLDEMHEGEQEHGQVREWPPSTISPELEQYLHQKALDPAFFPGSRRVFIV